MYKLGEKRIPLSLSFENSGKPNQSMLFDSFVDDLPSRVDVVGYVDPNKRIKQMVEAGIRIDAWNHAVYDFENADEEDDGYSMASERDDLDDLEMLSEANREKELYYREMYGMYRKALEAQASSGQESVGSVDSGKSSTSEVSGEAVPSESKG